MRDFEFKKRQILDRIDIVDLVSEHVTLKRSGRRWVGLCPFHTEKTPSFTVSPEHGLFKCFGCGKGGDVFSFLQFRENLSFREAMSLLAERAGVELDDAQPADSAGPSRADLVKVNAWAAQFFRARLLDASLGRSVREYLRRRQVSTSTAEQFGLGLATDARPGLRSAAAAAGIDLSLLLATDLVREGDGGRYYDTFRNRLMFPIHDAGRRVIGFGGRTLADDRAKYLNTSQNALFDKGRNLYGIFQARDSIARSRRAVVVEGYMDCLAAHQAGVTETVAALGTALTEAQVDLLRRYCDTIILLFDSDEAGEAAAERAIRVALPRCVTVRLARVPSGQDPSDFIIRAAPGEFSDLLNHTVDALEFKWLQTRERFREEGSDRQRREAILDFLRLVGEAAEATAVDAIQRGLLVNQVAHLLQMDRREVDRIMAGLRKRGGRRVDAAADQQPVMRREVPASAEQAAWVHVLEVLLNDPGQWSCLDHHLDVSRVADARDRRIATIISELAERSGDFRLADVVARLHDPEDVGRVAELARRGAMRGNYENTFRQACERIREALKEEEVERSRRAYFSAKAREESSEDSRLQVASFNDKVRGHRHYVPRRLSRRIVGGPGTTGH